MKNNIFAAMFLGALADLDQMKQRERHNRLLVHYGFTLDGIKWGCEKLVIPHIYDDIEFVTKYETNLIYCTQHQGDANMIFVYNTAGNPLVAGEKIEYLGNGWFLSDGYLSDGAFLSKHQYKTIMNSQFKDGYCQLATKEPETKDKKQLTYEQLKQNPRWAKTVVVNLQGEEVYMSEGSLGTPYVYGIILHDHKGYLNLKTGERLPIDRYCGTTIHSETYMFLEDFQKCVYQVNKLTGEIKIWK